MSQKIAFKSLVVPKSIVSLSATAALLLISLLSGCAGMPSGSGTQFGMALASFAPMIGGKQGQSLRQAGQFMVQQDMLAQRQQREQERREQAAAHQRWLNSLPPGQRLAYEREQQRKQTETMRAVGAGISLMGELARQPDVILVR